MTQGILTDSFTCLQCLVCNWTGQRSEEWPSGDLAAVIRRCVVHIPWWSAAECSKVRAIIWTLSRRCSWKRWLKGETITVFKCGIPPGKTMHSLSVPVTTFCALLFVSERTMGQWAVVGVLCSPGPEGHTVAALTGHWRMLESWKGSWSVMWRHLSAASFSHYLPPCLCVGCFPSLLALCLSRLFHSCLTDDMFQKPVRKTRWLGQRGHVGQVAPSCCWLWVWRLIHKS